MSNNNYDEYNRAIEQYNERVEVDNATIDQDNVVNKPCAYFYPARLAVVIACYCLGTGLGYWLGIAPFDVDHVARDFSLIQGMIVGWVWHWFMHD